MNPFTIALPAGRLAEESMAFFRECGLADFQFTGGRELSLCDTTGTYRVIFVRSQDVPTYVIQGGADAGITGRDVLAERGYDLVVPADLPFGYCRLSIACSESLVATLYQKKHLRIATKYPRLAADFFFKKGMSCEIIKLHGSIEIAPILNLSDCIVDLVSTGQTLLANGLKEIDVILESRAVLVTNRSVYARETKLIRNMLMAFKNTIRARQESH